MMTMMIFMMMSMMMSLINMMMLMMVLVVIEKSLPVKACNCLTIRTGDGNYDYYDDFHDDWDDLIC